MDETVSFCMGHGVGHSCSVAIGGEVLGGECAEWYVEPVRGKESRTDLWEEGRNEGMEE